MIAAVQSIGQNRALIRGHILTICRQRRRRIWSARHLRRQAATATGPAIGVHGRTRVSWAQVKCPIATAAVSCPWPGRSDAAW